MLKIFAFLTKREGMETPAFIDYYENHHVLSEPGTGAIVVADEEKFLDRSRYWAYVIDERVTTGCVCPGAVEQGSTSAL